ncbi:MAG: radical SAM protein [Muribaculaceae bacterium]|nr:radical SAM protein [Muribaculaceae bacterium]
MFVRLSKNSFVRTTEQLGYIVNQKTRLERMYAETGVDYLKAITREIQSFESIVRDKLMHLYDATFEEIYSDFYSVMEELADNGFVFIGNTKEDLQKNEDKFNSEYKSNTVSKSFLQKSSQSIEKSTQETILDIAASTTYLMSLQFELTSKCNERCIHCYIPNIKKDLGFDLPFDLFKRSIDQFADMGGLQVSLSGGEIFMHKDITKIIRYCREKDMQITLLSNLLALTEEHIAVIKEANVSMVQASLYSMDPNVHDMITKVNGSYYKTRRATERLVKEDIPVMISCPIMKANADSYPDILHYAHSLGIKAQTDFILMAQENLNTENLKNRLSTSEAENVIRTILKNAGVDSADSISAEGQPNRVNLKLSQPVCAAGITNLCINANGDVYPCNGWQGFKAGNIKTDSLNEIWTTSDSLKQLRKITRESFVECINCDVKDYCSICLARNYNESKGNPFHINPNLCEIARINRRVHNEMIQENPQTNKTHLN